MHISQIDFPQFYGETLGPESGASDFVECVRRIPADESKAKIVVHQAARMVWLADRIEECAAKRPALQILFFVIAAEAVAKIVAGFEGEGESKSHVRLFFEQICPATSRQLLRAAFSSGIACGFVSVREAIDFLYRIRCDVVHEGKYFTYSLKEDNGLPMMTPNKEGFLVAHVTARQIRSVVLAGALMGAGRLLPPDSPCCQLLHL